jgi:hypothetical protein
MQLAARPKPTVSRLGYPAHRFRSTLRFPRWRGGDEPQASRPAPVADHKHQHKRGQHGTGDPALPFQEGAVDDCCGHRAAEQERIAMNLLAGWASIAMAIGLGMYLSGSVTAQQLQYACDQNGDARVDPAEARICTDREFDALAVNEALTAEQLGAIGQQEIPLSEVDENNDGAVNREEWIDYVEGQFNDAAEASGGTMSLEDYAKWRQENIQP